MNHRACVAADTVVAAAAVATTTPAVVMCALSVNSERERRIRLDVTADVTLSPKFSARIFIKIICALAGNAIIS